MSDLVTRVEDAIRHCVTQADNVNDWSNEARAAIKAVAEWLDEQHQIDRDGSAHCALSKQLKEDSE